MVKITEAPQMPQVSKGIVVNGGQGAPLIMYGKDRSLPIVNDVIIFDEGKFTPKSVNALEVLERWKSNGLVVNGSLSKFKVGDTVRVSDEGVWSMGQTYWMRDRPERRWVITKEPTKYAVGMRWGCEEGALPEEKYLTLIDDFVAFPMTEAHAMSEIKIGDTVLVSQAGIEWMVENSSYGGNYWMVTESSLKHTVTDFYSSGTRCKCKDGILPPKKFLTVIGRAPTKVDPLVPQLKPWSQALIEILCKKYPNEFEEKELEEALAESFNVSKDLHRMRAETANWAIKLVEESRTEEFIKEYFSNEDPYYLGSFRLDFLSKVFPKFETVFFNLAEIEAYESIGEVILQGIEGGVDKIIKALLEKEGPQQALANYCNYYDNTAIPFEYLGKKYYILRQD